MSANEAAPGKRADLVDLAEKIERVVGALANQAENRPKLIERRFFGHSYMFI